MLDLGELAARVHIDDRAVPGELNQVHRRFGMFSSRIRRDAQAAGTAAGQGLGQSFAREASSGVSRFSMAGAMGTLTRFGAAGVTALAAVGGAGVAMGVKIAAGNENAQIAFATMLGSGQKAKSFLSDLAAFAAKTPFEFPELQTAASSLISAGVEAKNVIPIMTSLGNTTSGMGTGAEGVKRATVALQQMNAAGKITAEDLNQLRDAGIPVYDLLATATGKSKKEIAELAQTGKLGKKELTQMMDALASGKGLERFNGLMEKQSASLNGMWSTVKDTIGQGLAKAIAPVIPLLKDGLGGAAAFAGRVLAAVPEKIEWIIKAGKGLYSLLVEGDYKGLLRDTFGWDEDAPVIDIILDIRTGLLGLIGTAKAWWAATKSREAAPLREALSSIGDSLYRLSPFFDNAKGSAGGLAKVFPVLTKVAHALVQGVQGVARGLEYLVEHRGSVLDFLTPIGAAFKSLWAQLRNIDMNTVRAAIGSVAEAIGKLGPILNDFLASLPAMQPTLDAAGKGFRFVADHMDLVGKALPYLIAGFAAYKAMQAANNVVGKDSLIGFALQLGSTVSLTLANRSLAKSLQGVSAATASSTATEGVSTLTRIRGTVATVASTVASKAAAAASKVWAAGQWILNAALTANPIGLVVLAIAGLVAAFIIVYKHSDKFRAIVTRAMSAVKEKASDALGWVKKNWPLILAILTGPLGLAVLGIIRHWDDIKGRFTKAKDWVTGTWKKGWGAVSGAISGAVSRGRESSSEELDKLKARFSAAKTWVAGAWRKAWSVAGPVIAGAVIAGRKDADENLTKLRERFASARAWVAGAFKRSWAAVKKVLSDPVGAGRDAVTAILGTSNSTGLRGRFWNTVEALGKIWDRLKAKMKSPIVSVISIINTGLLGAYNWVIDKLKLPKSFKADPIKIKGFRTGGATSYTGSDDDVAGVVHGNEHVFTAGEVRQAGGHARLAGLRKAIRGGLELPGYFLGGGANPLPGAFWRRHNPKQYPWARWAGDGNKIGDNGDPIKAYKSGTVASTVNLGGRSYGRVTRINHGGEQTLYAHQSRFQVNPGDRVREGQTIGNVGSTGNSTGPHLHFELKGGSGPVTAIGKIGAGIEKAVRTIVEKASWLGKFSNPYAFLKDRAASMMDRAGLGDIGGSGFAGAVKSVPGRLLEALKDKVTGFPEDAWHTVRQIASDVVSKASAGSSRGLGPRARTARAYVTDRWGITNIGGFSYRNIAGTKTLSKHATGKAIDIMNSNVSRGNEIANYFAGPGKGKFGVDNVIWRRRIHNSGRGWHRYFGVSPHTDHVHVDFYRKGGAVLPRGYADGTWGAAPGIRGVAERGPELVVNPGLRKFKGGEKVLNSRQTAEHLGSTGDRPYVGSLTLVSSGNVNRDLEEVGFKIRTISRGGVHA